MRTPILDTCLGVIVGTFFLSLLALGSSCKDPVTAYEEESLQCVNQSATRAEADACRARVCDKYKDQLPCDGGTQ
jgi:hypothetical protein